MGSTCRICRSDEKCVQKCCQRTWKEALSHRLGDDIAVILKK